jgi:hypothetical protein
MIQKPVSKEPTRLCVDLNDRPLYDQLKQETMFAGRATRELFVIAMAYGFSSGTKRVLENREGSGYVRTEYLTPEDKAFIYAVALSDSGDQSVLVDKETAFRTAEEYAHAGIKILSDTLSGCQMGAFAKHFELMLRDLDKETPFGQGPKPNEQNSAS